MVSKTNSVCNFCDARPAADVRMFDLVFILCLFCVSAQGVLIINGMFGISDEETDEMCVVETALDTNMAACCIKLEDFQKALDYAKMVL